jgi:hypothetical protein
LRIPSNKTGRIIAISAIPIVAAAVFYISNFFDLFPLIEYRQWLFPPIGLQDEFRWFYNVAILHSDWATTAFPRVTSFVGVGVFSSVCGTSAGCHNLIHIGMVLAAAAFLGALLAWQTANRYAVLIATAVLFFLFSTPALDAIAWQATIQDKFAVLMIAGFTLLVARVRIGRGILPTVVDQMVLLVLTILTVNTKEAAWSVVGSLALLAAAQYAETEPLLPSIRRAFARFGLSIIYTGIHVAVVLYNRFHIQQAEAARVMSGNAILNLQVFIGYLLNQHPFTRQSLAVVLGVFAVIVLLAVWITPERRTRLLLAWATLSFIFAMSIPLRTTAQPPFYLLVPGYYLSIVLFWTVVAVADAVTWRPVRMVGAATIAVGLVVYLAGFADWLPFYMARVTRSRNFQKTLKVVAGEVARNKSAGVTFYYPPASLVTSYIFVQETGPDGHALARYIVPAGASDAEIGRMEKTIHDAPIANDGPGAPVPNQISVYLREDMTIAQLR